MRFDVEADLSRRTSPSELPEWMDEPGSYEDFRECLIDLCKVNRLTLGHRPTLDFLDRLIVTAQLAEPLRICCAALRAGLSVEVLLLSSSESISILMRHERPRSSRERVGSFG
jgi:hypothetical protein